MRIGLIDVDAESRGIVTFPNLALMKISAWHKAQGDSVEWYKPLISGHMDKVYMSKVFGSEYTKDYEFPIDADRIIKGGSGYAISIVDGKEVYDKELDTPLDPVIDHMMPDYSLYGITDTAYGFLTKGCPRSCPFCHVSKMQGRKVVHGGWLEEFWAGQKNIVLLDPNLTASPIWYMHFADLERSGAWVDFSHGLDLRLMDEKKIEALNRVKWKRIHFAWDNPEDDMLPKLKMVMAGLKRANRRTITVYILTNYNSTHEQDLMRVMAVREAGAQPDVRIYRKPTAPRITRQLARWVNAPNIFWSVPTFEEYLKGTPKMIHDMTTIVQPLNLLVSDELDRASKIHGETFASTHEGFGVIAEEVREVGDELEIVEGNLSTMLAFIREGDSQKIADIADCLRDRAVNAAAEMIQVAAMCEKMTRTVTG